MQQAPSIMEFRPAKPSRIFTRLMRLVNRFWAMPRARVCCEIRDAERLRSLSPGVPITPNHSDYADAMVVTELLRQTGRFAAFMAARENFDFHHGLNGLVMQWMGGFSVNRGRENAKCQQFAKDVVKRGQYDLLVFPEGEVYALAELSSAPCLEPASRDQPSQGCTAARRPRTRARDRCATLAHPGAPDRASGVGSRDPPQHISPDQHARGRDRRD